MRVTQEWRTAIGPHRDAADVAAEAAADGISVATWIARAAEEAWAKGARFGGGRDTGEVAAALEEEWHDVVTNDLYQLADALAAVLRWTGGPNGYVYTGGPNGYVYPYSEAIIAWDGQYHFAFDPHELAMWVLRFEPPANVEEHDYYSLCFCSGPDPIDDVEFAVGLADDEEVVLHDGRGRPLVKAFSFWEPATRPEELDYLAWQGYAADKHDAMARAAEDGVDVLWEWIEEE